MTYSSGSKLAFEAARVAASGAVVASYTALGDPLSHEASIVVLNNSLDKDVYVSFDGATDHLYLSASETLVINVEGNKSDNGKLVLPKKTQIYQKRGPGGASGSGNLIVMVGYAG